MEKPYWLKLALAIYGLYPEYIERGVARYQMGRNADPKVGQSWAANSNRKMDRVPHGN